MPLQVHAYLAVQLSHCHRLGIQDIVLSGKLIIQATLVEVC